MSESAVLGEAEVEAGGLCGSWLSDRATSLVTAVTVMNDGLILRQMGHLAVSSATYTGT